MRNTSVNHYILAALEEAGVHLTAQQVHERVKASLPSVNPSTIYRALERLAREGLISMTDMGGEAMVFETLSLQPHHHLICQKCGHTSTLDDGVVQSWFQQVQQQSGFAIQTHHLALYGICPYCQQQPKP